MQRIKILEKASELRHKLGDINRQLAFAGIAVVWIFKMKEGTGYSLPNDLLNAVMYIIIALGIDLLHYIWLTGLHITTHWYNEAILEKKPDAQVKFYWFIPRISDLMLIGKVFFNVLGFCKILSFLTNAIIAIQ